MQTHLVLDCSTSACSVALRDNGQVYTRYEEGQNLAATSLLGMVQSVMQEAKCEPSQLDVIAVCYGPGAFTGLRIGVGIAQGLAFAWKVPLVTVSSLALLAQHMLGELPVSTSLVVGLDARMSQLYWQSFHLNEGVYIPSTEIALSAPEEVEVNQGESVVFLGNAWDVYLDAFSPDFSKVLASSTVIDRLPRAVNACPLLKEMPEAAYKRPWLGDVVSPLYVRNDVAKVGNKRYF